MGTTAMSFTLIKPSTCFAPKTSSSSNPQRLRVFTLRCSSQVASSGLAERPWKVSDARLVLEDGSVWKAKSFGASGTQLGEVVFNTSLTGHSRTRKGRFGNCPFWSFPVSMARASEQSPGLVGEETLTQIKSDLYQALEGINRGIFGVPSAKKSEIEGLVKQLESLNPTPDPTLNLEKVVGCWKLVYSTITILGSKRTKLGLRDFISLGDFFQTIDVAKSKAVNVIKFNVRGFKMLDGKLTIEASFKISSTSRVDISYDSSSITPEQLMNVFRKNYDLLLGIFNPEGWLEITFVDDTMRIGRDDKGNIFILERSEDD